MRSDDFVSRRESYRRQGVDWITPPTTTPQLVAELLVEASAGQTPFTSSTIRVLLTGMTELHPEVACRFDTRTG